MFLLANRSERIITTSYTYIWQIFCSSYAVANSAVNECRELTISRKIIKFIYFVCNLFIIHNRRYDLFLITIATAFPSNFLKMQQDFVI